MVSLISARRTEGRAWRAGRGGPNGKPSGADAAYASRSDTNLCFLCHGKREKMALAFLEVVPKVNHFEEKWKSFATEQNLDFKVAQLFQYLLTNTKLSQNFPPVPPFLLIFHKLCQCIGHIFSQKETLGKCEGY